MFAYFSADLFDGHACDVQQGELENDHVNRCNARFDSDLSDGKTREIRFSRRPRAILD